MTHMHRTSLLGALALMMVACGDDESPGTTPSPEGTTPEPAEVAGVPRFEEVALDRGVDFHMTFLAPEQGEDFKINLYDHGSGVVIADADGDGVDDIYLLNQLGGNALFRNRGDGTFEDVTETAGVALADRISVAAAMADVDGDGDNDLYVTTTRGGNALFRNEGDGTFKDVTAEAGLVLVQESMSPVFFDIEGDGDLDLFVTNTARWTLNAWDEGLRYFRGPGSLWDLVDSEKLPNVLYRNDGKGVFTDITAEAGVAGRGWGGDVAVFDMELDGDLDMFVCNMFGESLFFRNDGEGRFEEVGREILGRSSWGAVGTRAFDYDGDGLLDLYVVDMHSDMWSLADMPMSEVEEEVKYDSFLARQVAMGTSLPEDDIDFERRLKIQTDQVLFGNTLYRNKGDGTFEEVSDAAGAETWWPWGIAAADYDRDGWVDVFIPSGMGYPYPYMRNPLLHNQGDGTFKDVTRTGGTGTEPQPGGPFLDIVYRGKKATRSGRCAATGDLDGDGRVDIVANNFNDRAHLFRNISADAHWVGLRLEATSGHHQAIGALAYVTAGGRTQVRQVQAAGGYLAQSSNDLHFGLGDAMTVERVEIRWPGGTVQVLEDVAIDQRTTVTEPSQ